VIREGVVGVQLSIKLLDLHAHLGKLGVVGPNVVVVRAHDHKLVQRHRASRQEAVVQDVVHPVLEPDVVARIELPLEVVRVHQPDIYTGFPSVSKF
jgi:hypothetical protein